MHPQLETIAREFDAATERFRALGRLAPEDFWTRRPDPSRWSIAECIAHLNLTSTAYVPLLREGLVRARGLGAGPPGRYHRDPLGWLLWKGAGPPARFRVKTTPSFVPNAEQTRERLKSEFERLQNEQLACVREADGLPIHRITITSPFNQRLKYNLYAGLTILPRHQHRHLWQAEQVWQVVGQRGR
jgi:hypothetical protein